MKKLLLAAALIAIGWWLRDIADHPRVTTWLNTARAELVTVSGTANFSDAAKTGSSDQKLAEAFEKKISKLQISGSGEVIRILADDEQGSRHQRFILRLGSGQTLLMAHNIDLAPRLDGLSVGDTVEFYGVYEWNSKGGVIHWTHRDPSGKHAAGWLKYRDKKYQ